MRIANGCLRRKVALSSREWLSGSQTSKLVLASPRPSVGALRLALAASMAGTQTALVAAAVVAADAQTVMAWQSKPRPPSLQLTSGSTHFKLIGIDIAFVTVLASHCFSEYSLANYTSVVPEVEWCF